MTMDATDDRWDSETTARADLLLVYAQRRADLCRFFAVRLRNTAESEDLVQELYLRLQNANLPAEISNPVGFVFTMASNMAFDHRRSGARRSRRQAIWGDVNYDVVAGQSRSDDPTQEDVLSARQLLARIDEKLNSLPERTAAIFRLHKFSGLSYAQVACELDISSSTVEKHMIRALQHIMGLRQEDTS
ncbi:MAG: sigma-70 family RNA polymerase sigma factor [Hyphomonas sp.]|nr:sigma-70 family RNA polymerase sigma factor [Hyphomonas sp.]